MCLTQEMPHRHPVIRNVYPKPLIQDMTNERNCDLRHSLFSGNEVYGIVSMIDQHHSQLVRLRTGKSTTAHAIVTARTVMQAYYHVEVCWAIRCACRTAQQWLVSGDNPATSNSII